VKQAAGKDWKMKKAILVIVAILVFAWAGLWVGSTVMSRTHSSREWPAELGRIQDVPGRYPETKLSSAAVELMTLSAAAGVDIAPRQLKERPAVDDAVLDAAKKDLSEWSGVQLARATGPIDATPAPVVAYLTRYHSQLDAVRDHLLHGDPLVWPSNLSLGHSAPIPNLLGHMQLTRVFVARALEKSRAGDETAWNELYAAWNLNRRLWTQPTMIEVLIALATTRMVNAAAMKAPSVEPEWFAEVRAVDSRKAMLHAHQAEAWMMSTLSTSMLSGDGEEKPNQVVARVKETLFGVFLRLSATNTAERLRLFATEVATVEQCDFNGEAISKRHYEAIPRWNIFGRIAMPNLGGAWQRLLRYQAELEASERSRQMKLGQKPTSSSRCSDGTWQVTTGSNGTQTVRFSRDIPVPAPGVKYPLEFTTTKSN
jgi:hypothetical protein